MSTDDAPLRQTAWLYTRGQESVHMEVRPTASGFVLDISGPGHASAQHPFPDLATLVPFRERNESELIERGFRLQAVAERRVSSGDADPSGIPREKRRRR